MQECKHCGCEQIVKNGIVQGKQRYLCNGCKRTFREGDQRVKYSGEVRIRTLKWYLDGAGIRAIERNEGVPAPLILQWIRKSGALLKEQISRIQPPDDLKKIQILELDELYTYCKKKLCKAYIWLAVDRVRNKVVDFEVSTSKDFDGYLPMAMRLKDRYDIEISASDGNPSYGKFMVASNHAVTKAETALVECYNSLLRHYLARFNRKTKRFSKAMDMIEHSVLLLFYKLNKTILPPAI